MQEVVRESLPRFSENVHLIQADAAINTYDIVEIADLGLVYTTTVGMEMAMSGVPVVVAGFTHYRGKGFTIDPNSWNDFFEQIDQILQNPSKFRLTREQIKDVWHYAYRFFFEFTRPFPWHLLYFWDDVEKWPLDQVLASEGQDLFGDTLSVLTGEPLDWSILS
jgi:capsule polysaccharide export protein KpsC/LpsZ